jgi:hypothetical protein
MNYYFWFFAEMSGWLPVNTQVTTTAKLKLA